MHRLLATIATATCGASAAPVSAPEPTAPSAPIPGDSWVEIAASPPVAVSAERALYERPGAPHFFVHVRVRNGGAGPIGVDLRKYFEVFYPNQWGAAHIDHRQIIDERRVVLPAFDAAAKQATIADYRAGAFATIAQGDRLDYYVEFNASGRPEVDAQATLPWLIVAMDGQLRFSDGTIAGRLEIREAARELAIPAPIAWKTVPDHARVIAD
jgi:hypothetical protein